MHTRGRTQSTLQCTVMKSCSLVEFCTVQYCVEWFSAVLWTIVQCSIAKCCSVQYYVGLYSAILWSLVRFRIVYGCRVHYFQVFYSAVLWSVVETVSIVRPGPASQSTRAQSWRGPGPGVKYPTGVTFLLLFSKHFFGGGWARGPPLSGAAMLVKTVFILSL